MTIFTLIHMRLYWSNNCYNNETLKPLRVITSGQNTETVFKPNFKSASEFAFKPAQDTKTIRKSETK